MEFNLINPSDPYTFIAADLEVAALTVFSIGAGYGAVSSDNKERVPIFNQMEWFVEKFGCTPDEALKERKKELAEALSSMMFGSFEDRKRYEAALSAIDDEEKKKEFIVKWQDGISSLNDIGTYCHKLADKLAEQIYMKEAEQAGL